MKLCKRCGKKTDFLGYDIYNKVLVCFKCYCEVLKRSEEESLKKGIA